MTDGLAPPALTEASAPAWVPGGHLQTYFPFLVRPGPLPAEDRLLVDVDDRSRVTVDLNRPRGSAMGTLLLVHGLGGCADSWYMLRSAHQALAVGWVVARMNCRNCGGTEALSRTLYNAGQSTDVGDVLERLAGLGLPRPLAVLGFSLGGNLVLRHAGMSGDGCPANAIVALNPPVDLESCCRQLERPGNVIFRRYFLYQLCRLIVRIRSVREVPGPAARWWRFGSLRDFDRLFVAPDAGFDSAEHYYTVASSGPHLAAIRRPTMIISARNDPVVPYDSIAAHHNTNPHIRFVHPGRGGHLGYWQLRKPRFLGAGAALSFLRATTRA